MVSEVNLSDTPKITVGLSWEPNEKVRDASSGLVSDIPHDLDLMCCLFSDGLNLIDMITPQEPKRDIYAQQIFHEGDHTSGGSDFEDEALHILFKNLDPDIKYIAIVVRMNEGLKISSATDAKCDFLNYSDLESLLSYDLSVAKGSFYLSGIIKKNHLGDWVLLNISDDLLSANAPDIQNKLRERLS